jgi:hypothetical protein
LPLISRQEKKLTWTKDIEIDTGRHLIFDIGADALNRCHDVTHRKLISTLVRKAGSQLAALCSDWHIFEIRKLNNGAIGAALPLNSLPYCGSKLYQGSSVKN